MRHIDLHRAAVALRECGSVAGAALRLFVPRSTLTRQIKKHPKLQRALSAAGPDVGRRPDTPPRCKKQVFPRRLVDRLVRPDPRPCLRPAGHTGHCRPYDTSTRWCLRCHLQIKKHVAAHECPHGRPCRNVLRHNLTLCKLCRAAEKLRPPLPAAPGLKS